MYKRYFFVPCFLRSIVQTIFELQRQLQIPPLFFFLWDFPIMGTVSEQNEIKFLLIILDASLWLFLSLQEQLVYKMYHFHTMVRFSIAVVSNETLPLSCMTVIVFSTWVCPIQMNNPNNGATKRRKSRIFFDLVCNVSFESNGQEKRNLKVKELIDNFILLITCREKRCASINLI